MNAPRRKRLAVLISFSGDGGVERMVTNLCGEFVKHVELDLLALKLGGGHVKRISESVNVIPLNSKHSWSSVGEVAAYLSDRKPDALMAAKDRAGRAAIRASKKAGLGTPVYIRLGTNLSAALARRDAFSRWLRLRPMRNLYPQVTGVIAVSEGVRQDTTSMTGLALDKIHVIRNPVITPKLSEQAVEPVPHDWLEEGRPLPVVMGIGRLTRQKDFQTLLRAFASIQPKRPSHLIILGDAPQPPEKVKLQELASQLGIEDKLLFAGFQSNPYAWLARADLFVLSSAWEGSPNALTEAMALGVPSVSTDCPSGPIEILDRGRFGPLVDVGDDRAMAEAMIQTLDSPGDAEFLKSAVDEYRAELSARRYLELMGLIDGLA